eukprot:TRINITY_DN48214_c0_g1_i1.p1 TRINITY_DN48214_c0_g1~~TRINITY_DN48214_c0_g1_i1.p1  ORF type:complete len:708 (+),score=206.44 TRINITY_DN48214_c0_g1_i1:49-2124(+)
MAAAHTDPAPSWDGDLCVTFTDTDGDTDRFAVQGRHLYCWPGAAGRVRVDKVVWETRRRRGTKDERDRAPHLRVFPGWRMTPSCKPQTPEWAALMTQLRMLAEAAGAEHDLPQADAAGVDKHWVRNDIFRGDLQRVGGGAAELSAGGTVAVFSWCAEEPQRSSQAAEAIQSFVAECGAAGVAIDVVAVGGGELPKGWLTVEGDGGRLRGFVDSHLESRGPGLLLVTEAGRVAERCGMLAVAAGVPRAQQHGFGGSLVGDLSVGPFAAGSDVSRCRFVAVLCDGCEAQAAEQVVQQLQPLAKKAVNDGTPLLYFVATRPGPVPGWRRDALAAAAPEGSQLLRGWTARALRAWCGGGVRPSGDGRPLLLLVDGRDSTDSKHAFASDASWITAETVQRFVAACDGDTVDRLPLDFGRYEETGAVAAEAAEAAAPGGRGMATTLEAVNWGAFGDEGAPASDSSDDDSSAAASDDPAQRFLQQFSAGPKKTQKAAVSVSDDATREELIAAVRQLNQVVAEQRRTIDSLTERLRDSEAASAAAGAPPKGWKSEDDDSDDSEAAAYRASMKERRGSRGPQAGDLVPGARGGLVRKAPEVPKAQDDDWSCGSCFQFNWGSTGTCAHCGWVDESRATAAAAAEAPAAAAGSQWENEDDSSASGSPVRDMPVRAGGGVAGHSSLMAQLGGADFDLCGSDSD